ncbi:MAG: site-specific integrase [Clostridiaceae bacterium]|nr:site-specific integrase [Clostridiaceae bacterium]
MGRIRKEIRYQQRYKKIWYYKIKDKRWKSSGSTLKRVAVEKANKALLEPETPKISEMTFKEYAKDFFIPGKCPRERRLEIEGTKPTDRHLIIQRMNLTTHVLSSPLANKKMGSIKRADILNLRDSLFEKELMPSTVNKIISAVKTIFSEAEYREDLLYNPSKGVKNVKGEKSTVDIFTDDEIRTLFKIENYEHIWGDFMTYTCFLLALNTGMRRGEVLALRWEHVNFDEKYVAIKEAWKSTTTIGKPKSNEPRDTPLTNTMIEILKKYKKQRFMVKDSDLVFAYCDGSRLGETWWKKNFDSALRIGNISTENRKLTPHSLRHTLNTKLRSKNENPDKIRAALGWSSEAIQDRYTHCRPDHFRELGEAMEKAYEGLF